ncbi:hypothetical protein [uncultured Tateyamaria sp.]|uniref:hypothetical protein n=1 Tax=uncultured Tateyamaria sp. TaxID=455651 RepID=UPI00261B9F30|nr:hypothetical protein [uncultured Tateyamaria sp.]
MVTVSAMMVAALTAGATAIGKEFASASVKDGYAKLKALLAKRSAALGVLIDTVEEDPASEPEQAVLAKQLDRADLSEDGEVLEALQSLAKAVEDLRDSAAGAGAVIDFDTVSIAGSVDLKDISAQGGVFRAKSAEIGGDFRAEGITQKK